jgi:hypothetical protein
MVRREHVVGSSDDWASRHGVRRQFVVVKNVGAVVEGRFGL